MDRQLFQDIEYPFDIDVQYTIEAGEDGPFVQVHNVFMVLTLRTPMGDGKFKRSDQYISLRGYEGFEMLYEKAEQMVTEEVMSNGY